MSTAAVTDFAALMRRAHAESRHGDGSGCDEACAARGAAAAARVAVEDVLPRHVAHRAAMERRSNAAIAAEHRLPLAIVVWWMSASGARLAARRRGAR